MTIIPFTPNNHAAPPFAAVVRLDGASYLMNVTWNIYSQRWYMTLLDQSNTPTWSGAMVGSPLDYDILLAPNVFTTSTILFREDTGNIEIVP